MIIYVFLLIILRQLRFQPEFSGRKTGIFLEDIAEIMRITEPGFIGNIGAFHSGAFQEQFCAFYTHFSQVFNKVLPGFLRENRTQMVWAYANMRRC